MFATMLCPFQSHPHPSLAQPSRTLIQSGEGGHAVLPAKKIAQTLNGAFRFFGLSCPSCHASTRSGPRLTLNLSVSASTPQNLMLREASCFLGLWRSLQGAVCTQSTRWMLALARAFQRRIGPFTGVWAAG